MLVEQHIKNNINPYYCVSHYEGDLDWMDQYPKCGYVIYSKGAVKPNKSNVKILPNVGYNLSSYLDFIISNYENLPEITVFCKNNIFERHVKEDRFKELVTRCVFTPLEDNRFWSRLSFPISVISNDGGYLEFNNNWFATKYKNKYFANYSAFYKLIFDTDVIPSYLRFSPGANYLVPKENILLRSKNFYVNLNTFISHDQLSCESHFLERSLVAIWNSNLKESDVMTSILSQEQLDTLIQLASANESKPTFIRRYAHRKIIQFFNNILGSSS